VRIESPGVVLMRPLVRDLIVFAVAATAGVLVTGEVFRAAHSPARGLPYHDGFARGEASEWVAYDGNWNVQGGVMVNESNERGAKLVTGSRYWTNYVIDADIALSDTGEAGIVARVSNAEPGVDAYRGVYVGLRVRDESLVVGVADHAWNELAARPLPHPIIANVWYHIQLRIEGCDLQVAVSPDGQNGVVRVDERLVPCPERGKIGLRSYDSGGQWKNIRVTELKEHEDAF
jgi:hypothetical protein